MALLTWKYILHIPTYNGAIWTSTEAFAQLQRSQVQSLNVNSDPDTMYIQQALSAPYRQ